VRYLSVYDAFSFNKEIKTLNVRKIKMKKQLFLTAVLALLQQLPSFAQSIKLNNEADPGSAMLEVNSASKGILIPNVALTGITDAITIALPAVSLLVYNTATVSDVEPGYYYNSGTAVSPFWTRLSTSTSPGTAGDGSETKVEAGTNVTVTGSGTSASPYEVNAVGGDGSETKVTAGTNVTVTGSGTSTSPYEVNAVGGDGSETKVEAGTNVTVTGSGTSGSPYIVNASEVDGDVANEIQNLTEVLTQSNDAGTLAITNLANPTNAQDAATKAYVDLKTSSPTYSVGLSAEQGGYIFWVSADGKHGLVAETVNQSNVSSWYDAQDIISNPSNHSADGQKFRDWRLPTKFELNEMWKNLHRFGCSNTIPDSSLCATAIGGFSSSYYWSSKEIDINDAWEQDFSDGSQYGSDKSYNGTVRAVRAF
jgi:hypothetical protein